MSVEKKNRSTLFWCLFAVLMIYTVSLIALVGWGLIGSFRDGYKFNNNPFKLGDWTLENYKLVIEKMKYPKGVGANKAGDADMWEMLGNSFVYSFGCAFCNTFVTCIVAYCASRFNFRFCKALYTLVVVVMVLPIVGNLPSEIAMAKTLGTYDHMWGMFIMKSTFLGTYFLIFGAIFKGIPRDYMEAGYIDGANDYNIFFRIMLPMVSDTFKTILLLNFIAYWNDYSIPLVYLHYNPPIALGLYYISIKTDDGFNTVPPRLAACFYVFIPIFVIFVVFQNKLMGNLSMGGLKE